jgi:hypothetical protein
MLSESEKKENLTTFKRYLVKLIGETETQNLIETLGGEESIKNASFGMTEDSGSAYEGSLLENVLAIAEFGLVINNRLPESNRVEAKSIYKVALLQHLSKVLMYEKNTNQWEIDNRGMIYKFRTFDTVLKGGERSLFILMQAGINDITEEEFEAIRVVDKIKESDFSITKHVSTLACIMKQANEINSLLNTVK